MNSQVMFGELANFELYEDGALHIEQINSKETIYISSIDVTLLSSLLKPKVESQELIDLKLDFHKQRERLLQQIDFNIISVENDKIKSALIKEMQRTLKILRTVLGCGE